MSHVQLVSSQWYMYTMKDHELREMVEGEHHQQ